MEDSTYPEVVVGALVVNPQGKIFLMRSWKWRDKYVMPGGHIEHGETMEQAVKREMLEETGLRVYDVKFLLLQEFIFGTEFVKKKHFIFLDHTCKTRSTRVKLNSEGAEYVWVGPAEALQLDLEPYTRKMVKTYIKEQKHDV